MSNTNSDVLDSTSKIDDEVAVGEDLAFQERWWQFERIVWGIFVLILIMTLLGCFGRGYLARAQIKSNDNTMTVRYDRIQRTGSPSDIKVVVERGAVRDGQVRLFVSESLVNELGAQRVIPQPERTFVGDRGLTYIFPALEPRATIIFSVEPTGPGAFPFTVAVPNSQTVIESKIYVVP